MQIEKSFNHKPNFFGSAAQYLPEWLSGMTRRPVDRAWRCDLHPAWSRDFEWVVINGRPTGGNRQVILLHLGPDLSRYFRQDH